MPTLAQRLMGNPLVSAVYESAWRPVFTRMFSLGGSATAMYDRAFTAYLARSGERQILDVACGPGLYTRRLARNLTGDGRCVGIDYSETMLSRAVAKPHPRTVFIRGDAHRLPFPDDAFDTVACFAALYLIPDPLPVVDELVRVTRPGGEIAIFTSVRTPLSRLPGVKTIGNLGGYHFFERHEIPDRLRAAGVTHIEQTVVDQGQFVLARKDLG
ncbi:menaquinone biosynthesis methyltransferase MenH [Gordonia araii NBRC 100433]|uniref:Menaquinone biosynthesis methyltransferase MenH n=1 Tax=Gordonia araii NBRC 100433 TaxID=1073574 RepID=G7H1A6_9ACTN|nr:class I SAM-dependent methyltransferase [Gordonia araii]NNG97608.1 class I SAM-dependent methyltransferase [Gordonia araii NBRC 100433]GAB09631.1 menaquinone biosynthesis methyltransferase MenH [Gordonia araii NBRC 100433]